MKKNLAILMASTLAACTPSHSEVNVVNKLPKHDLLEAVEGTHISTQNEVIAYMQNDFREDLARCRVESGGFTENTGDGVSMRRWECASGQPFKVCLEKLDVRDGTDSVRSIMCVTESGNTSASVVEYTSGRVQAEVSKGDRGFFDMPKSVIDMYGISSFNTLDIMSASSSYFIDMVPFWFHQGREYAQEWVSGEKEKASK